MKPKRIVRYILTLALLFFVYRESGIATALSIFLIGLRFEIFDKYWQIGRGV